MKMKSTIFAFLLSVALASAAYGQTQEKTISEVLGQFDRIESWLIELLDLHQSVPDPVPEPEPEPTPDPVPPEPQPEPEPTPEPTAGVPAAIATMPAGSWLHYGAPWDEAAPAEMPCGKRFKSVLDEWNGWARDGLRYIYVAASGGHGDGCDNGVYRYDIQTGRAENIVPHVELNADLGIDPATGDDFRYPYVADENGVQILPRSSHTYKGVSFETPWFYLFTGSEYGGGISSGQVWRFHVEELRWERLPDRREADGDKIGSGIGVSLVNAPGGMVLLGGWITCDVDPVAGQYDCQSSPFSLKLKAGVAWDSEREGIWYVEAKHKVVRFLRRVNGAWQIDEALSGMIPDNVLLGGMGLGRHSGICVVPGQGILVWSKSSDLYHWDGTTWSVVSAPGGPPPWINRAVESKWSWDDEAQACIGGSTVKEGLWIYKPGQIEGDPPLPPEPAPELEPVEGIDLKAKWGIDRDNLASIGGVDVTVAPWEPAPWDQPIERLPGAPDYDAICKGGWAEFHYRTNADVLSSKYATEALLTTDSPNARIYVYPLKNAAGDVIAYTESLYGRSQCMEVIGVPDNGRKPQFMKGFRLRGGLGLIVRGVILAESGGNCPHVTMPLFVVIHDTEMYSCAGHTLFFGASRPEFAPMYLEQIGNVTAYAYSHAQYNERSVGRFVYKSNICFAPGYGQCVKNLANSSLIAGNVFSNVGLDGQVITSPSGWKGVRTYLGGMMPLNIAACSQSIVRDNTFIYRTTTNVQVVLTFRARGSWGNCNRGRRLADDSWEYLHPTLPAYHEPKFWEDVAMARPLFDEGWEAARASPVLMTHKVEKNRFIVVLAHKPEGDAIGRVAAAAIYSLRPVAKYKSPAPELRAESAALTVTCEENAECYYAGASEALKYAYDHLPDDWKEFMVLRGGLPSKIPIQPPENWVERVAMYWDTNQEGWACDAAGVSCEPWDMPVPRVPVEIYGYDAVMQNNPPRIIVVD